MSPQQPQLFFGEFEMGVSLHNGFANYVYNQSGPIGESSARESITVTEIIPDTKVLGGVKYGPEIRATKGDRILGILFQKKIDDGGEPSMDGRIRFEIQLAIHDDCPIKANWQSVLAGPAASTWVAISRFKGPHKKKTVPQKLNKPFRDLDAYLAQVEQLDYDLWESGKFLTAGLFVPPVLLDDNARNWSRGKLFHSACEDFDQCVSLLLNSDRANELIQMTNNRTLRIGQPDAPEEVKKLRDETVDEGNSLLLTAIKQAIAGVERKKDSGDSVMKQAEYLYKNHMLRKNRKVVNRGKKHTELRDQ